MVFHVFATRGSVSVRAETPADEHENRYSNTHRLCLEFSLDSLDAEFFWPFEIGDVFFFLWCLGVIFTLRFRYGRGGMESSESDNNASARSFMAASFSS